MPPAKAILDLHLATIAGTPITMASLLVAAAILATSVVIAGLIARSTQRVLGARGVSEGVRFATSKIVRYTIVLLGIVAAFNAIGLHLDALLAASAVVALGIGLGLQQVAQNFVSGLILLIEQPVRRGDFVRVGDTLGVVSDIGLRATQLITRDQVTIIVPNGQLITGTVINHSRPTLHLRIHVAVGVAYGTDPEKVRAALLDVAHADEKVDQEPEPEVLFESFGDSALQFALLVWIADPRDDLRTASRLRFAIERAFREQKIEMPFPQRDLHIRSGLELLRPAGTATSVPAAPLPIPALPASGSRS
jgi:small-conductance mechanosensitive channel